MRLTRYFLPVSKDVPADAAIISHQLMLRTGMVRQNGAGIYTWLPLGFRVLQKIEQIVREEMDRAGAIELLMPTIQQAELGRRAGATMTMARKCFALPTAMNVRCYSAPPMKS